MNVEQSNDRLQEGGHMYMYSIFIYYHIQVNTAKKRARGREGYILLKMTICKHCAVLT